MVAGPEIVIGDLDGQHVVIRPVSRSSPGLFDYWDGNWIVCEVEISAGGFRGRFSADMRSEEFHAFMDRSRSSTGPSRERPRLRRWKASLRSR